MKTLFVCASLGLLLGGCQSNPSQPPAPAATAAASVAPSSAPSATTERTLAVIIAGDHRSADNRARDRFRHPEATLAFFGITPSLRVLEITPGAGWYSEIIAPYVQAKGHFSAAIWDDSRPDFPKFYADLNAQLRAKVSARPELYGNVQLLPINSKAPAFGSAESEDAIVTFRNVHNWAIGGNADAWFKAFFAALKPGGVLGVVDHRAKPGTTLAATLKSGYLTEAYVIGLAEAAGFVLEARSEINANPLDDANHEAGVWSLPPTLRLGEKDRAQYLAIGESDRMTLRFRKPSADLIHSAND